VSCTKLIPFIIIVFLLSLGASIDRQNKNLSSLYYLAPFRAFEFCIGATLVWLLRHRKEAEKQKNALDEILCCLGFLLILYPVFAFNSNTLFPSYNALAPCIGAALLIYSGKAKISGYLLRNKAARFIGLISYSLYLIHWPLIVFAKTYNEDIGRGFELSTSGKFTTLFCSVLIASLMYRFIEQPFRKSTPKKHQKQVSVLMKWSAVISLFVILGCSVFYSNGWIWRAKSPHLLAKIKDISKYHEETWGGVGFSGGIIYQGKNPYPNIVMMGDSHSGMLDTGIVDELAKPNDLTIFTASGGGGGKYISSLLLPGITEIGANQEKFDKDAKTAYKKALSELLKSKHSILIYSASYGFQLAKAAHIDNHKKLNINTEEMTSYESYKPLLRAFDRLNALMKNHKLIIIGDVPGSSKYIPINCLSQLKWFKSHDCLSWEKENLKPGGININKVLEEYASKHSNIYFINPYNTFCQNGYCKNLDANGKPFYSDGAHLSQAGSKYFISNVKNQIINMINDN